MKKFIIPMMLLVCSAMAAAQVLVDRVPLGSGTPGNDGVENATSWSGDIYHTPQYMPGYPTAATLFPRVVPVACVQLESGLHCKGYHWLAEMGRAEYLMIRPVIATQTPARN